MRKNFVNHRCVLENGNNLHLIKQPTWAAVRPLPKRKENGTNRTVAEAIKLIPEKRENGSGSPDAECGARWEEIK